MNLPPPSSLDRVPFRSAWIYAAAAAAWVVLSDLAVALAEGNPSRELWMNIGKGLLFVLVSSGLLYVLLSRQLAREQAMRQELAAAQERFNSAVAQLPFTFAIYDADRRFRFLNARGLLEAGKPLGDVLGRRDEEVFSLERVNAYLPALLRALETRQTQTEVVDIAMLTRHAHLACTFTPLLGADGAVRELLAVSNDMTAVIRTDRQIRRYNRTLTAISAANSVLVRSTNEADLLQGFCEALVEPTGHRLVWVGLVTPSDPLVRVAAQAGLAGEYLNGIEIRSDDSASGYGPTGTCIRTGEPVVCHDFRTDEKMVPWRERAAHSGLRSCISVPLQSAGTVLGALSLYSSEPNRFDAEEVKLLVELANDLAYGLAAMRRQMALTAAETALVQERRLRESIMAHSTALVYVLDLEGRFLYTNPALDRAVGQPEGSAAGKLRAELLPKEIATAHQANDLKVARGGQPLQFEEGNLEDGASQTYLTVKFPLRDAVGKVFAVGGVSTNVTALKQSEAALKREQQRLANVIEATAIGTWEWNVQTGETVYNERWAGMLGYTLAELAPVSVKTWGELTHPEDARQVMQLVERHFAGELDRVECEYRMRHKAGHWVWISDSSRLLTRTRDGKPLFMIGMHRDITQRKQTELALQESEHRQRELAEGLAMAQVAGNIGSWETDALSLAVQWSEQTHRIFATDPATFTPTHAGFISRVHPDDRAAVDAAFRNSLAKAGDHTIEHRIVMADGRIKVVEERWRIYRDERGQPTRAVGTCQDITERKLAVDALRKSEELLRSVLADQTDIISRIKPGGTLVFVNEAFCRFFGKTAEELIGAQWQPKAVAEDVPLIQAKLNTLTPAHPLVTIENRVINGAGEMRWVQFANRGLFDPTGDLVEIQSVGRDITERRRVEASLEESQARLAHERALLRELLDSIPDLIFFKDQHSVYLGCNRAFEIYSGMRESELVGKSDLDLVPSVVAEAYRSKDREVLDAGRPQRNEEWIPFKDGGGGQFETLKTPYYGPNGETLGLIGISRDITERKQAEAQIRDALGYLGTLIEASPVGILSYDQTGQTQTANEAAARMVGARVEQLLAQNFRQIKSWQASGMLAAAERTLATRRPERVEAHFTTTFGKEVWLAMQFVPFQRGDAWHLLLLMTDISEQSKAAAQLLLQSAALDAAANSIVITDLSGTILWANAAFTRSTGYTFAEAVGQNPRLLKSGRHPREFYEGMWKTILGGHVWHGEMHNRRKDGTPLEEDATITPVKNAQGVITHFIAIKQDISDRKTLEKQFLRAQRMESIGLLAGGIAHDLNNVLAPILMGAEMLKLFTTDAEMNRQLDSIMQSAERGAGIVKQVLTFARGIEGERVVLHPKHIIKEMVRMVRETFPRNLQLHVDVPNELWPVLGDPTQLHQVLLNLSVNARDAMPDGGELTFSARNAEVDTALAKANPGAKPGPHVVLRVRDTGGGIPAAVMERIWEPFFTTKEVGKGTGLGLPTVLGIVRSHGGFIVVESDIGRGTSFDVYLPAAPQADGAVVVAKPDPLPLGKGELVLVVDDEPDLISVTRSMLERHGYRVVAANDGTAALAQISEQKHAIRLVITDILMPFMDGVQFIRALHRLMPGMPVIASSGALGMPGQQDRTDEVHALGVKQILHKPYGVEVLLRAVHAELHKGEAVPPV